MNIERYNIKNINYEDLPKPLLDPLLVPVPLEDETIRARTHKILRAMEQKGLDCAVVYEDLEHGGNFEYLTGFLTRFEEALLILHQTGEAFLVLGNENRKMAEHSRVPAALIHCPLFSLPNQPMDGEQSLKEIFRQAGLTQGMRAGLCGWKYFTGKEGNHLLDAPYYIIEGIKETIGTLPENCSDIWISPDIGARALNNANEIAHYEFGSALSAICVERALENIEPGKSEMEIAGNLDAFGQKHNVISICAAGERFEKANLYPSNKKIQIGDKMSVTSGFSGGLTSRAGYVVKDHSQLPDKVNNYLERLAKPYYAAAAAWLEQIHIGMSGGELYDIIKRVLPQEVYHWYLNPGHLCAEEEWLCSPIYENSQIQLKSGMILQLDIIPSIKGYGGTGAENGIALADARLRADIKEKYPILWQRFVRRRTYMREVLRLNLHDEVLPLSDTTGYYRPFFLDKTRTLVLKQT